MYGRFITMKDSLKLKKPYVIASILVVLAIGFTFLGYGISIWAFQRKFEYYIILLSFCFLYGLLAYVSGDLTYYFYKRSTGEFKPAIPDEIREKMFVRRLPFIYALVVVLLFTAIMFIISLFLGRWPFL